MTPGVALTPAERQAEQLRKDGNLYFKKDRFGAAIDAYTEAITLCPYIPTYWTNRARCHLKRNNWESVESDCRKALQLDQIAVKAHYMLGLALLQTKKYREAIKELKESARQGKSLAYRLDRLDRQSSSRYWLNKKALSIEKGSNPNGDMVDEIWQELAKAKYLEWEHSSTHRTWELRSLKEACLTALKETHLSESSSTEGFSDEVDSFHSKQLEELQDVFSKAALNDTPSEVPDYLCCKISLEIFRDPVIIPSGITYERSVITEHLLKVGEFDPITREPLNESQLIPNLAIKEAAETFLDKNGWAYKMD